MQTSEICYADLPKESLGDNPPVVKKAHEPPLIVCLQRPVPPVLERAFRHLAGLLLLASVLVLWLSWEAYEMSMTLEALAPDVSIGEFDHLVIVVPERLATRLLKHHRYDPFPFALGFGSLICGLLGWLGVRQALQQKQTVFDELVPTQEEVPTKPVMAAVGAAHPDGDGV